MGVNRCQLERREERVKRCEREREKDTRLNTSSQIVGPGSRELDTSFMSQRLHLQQQTIEIDI